MKKIVRSLSSNQDDQDFVEYAVADSGIMLSIERMEIVRHFVECKKPITALCHGVLILTAIDGIRGCTVATYEAWRRM